MEGIMEQLKNSNLKEELSSPLVQWAGFACALILVWWLIVSPYQTWRSSDISEIEQKLGQIERLERIENSRNSIEAFAEELKKTKQTAQQSLIETRTHSRALGEQVSLFEKVFRPKGLKFTGRRFGEPGIQPWLGEKVNSQWRISGGSDEILEMLFALSNERKLVELTQFEIKKGTKRRGDSQAQYEISLDIQSYRKLSDAQLRSESKL